MDYVGPGGFPDIVHGAKNIIFVGNWMHPCGVTLKEEKLKRIGKGTPKFVRQVREVTFNGQVALQQGKRVYYVTDIGLLQLSPQGLELIALFAGIRLQEDILAQSEADIYIPPGREVPVIVPRSGIPLLSADILAGRLPT